MKRLVSLTMAVGLLLSGRMVSAQQADIEWLSVPALGIGSDRVIAFDLKASGGSIRSFPNVPRGWFISITNDASGTTEVAGNAQVGAAALDSGYFKRFVGFQRQVPGMMQVSHITLDIVVTKDFVRERHIDIPASGLLLSKNLR